MSTADNQLNVKLVVKQGHTGVEKIKYERSRLKAVNLNQNEYFLKYKNAIVSVLYRYSLHTKGYGKVFPHCCDIFLPLKHLLNNSTLA